MAMVAKNQDILETFVVNILELTSHEVRLVSVETVCGDDGATPDLTTALSDPRPGGISKSPQDGVDAEETVRDGDEEPGAPDTILPRTHEGVSESFQIDAPFAPGTLPWETQTWPPEEGGPWIGPYHLLKKIGEGSFGIVYLAEQITPVRRQVALKLVQQDISARSLVERFKIESQALALMDHPNIARVLDAGTTSTGRPYFVMELLVGVPITKYCDEHELNCRERIELLIPVCKAIQHAHQKGIVHRDIKPSNVLVTLQDEVAVPKVIDFGVAKAVRQGLLGQLELTECHQLIGTPAYMSPEQVGLDGIDIDTRSDIYSLGVLLYELLTGTTPFSQKEWGYSHREDLWKLIREVEPPKPSVRVVAKGERSETAQRRRTDPSSLAKLLRGDLDCIVMTCLEKDRSRRYETAHGLELDIERYLKCEPVHASPPHLVYRLKKFARRHRGAVMASIFVAMALATGLITSLVFLAAYRERSIEVLRLSDMRVIEELTNGVPGFPGMDYRSRHNAMVSWVERARDVFRRRDWHRATLEKLRRRGTHVEAVPAIEGLMGSRQGVPDRWQFADTPTQWQHDLLEKLVAELDDLQGTSDKLNTVEAWLRRSPSESEIDSRWKMVRGPLEPVCGADFRLPDGWAPLGRNEGSGLWEFVDLNSGLEPERDAAGQMIVGPETGVVFVLIPGGKFRMGSPPDEAERKEDETQHDVEISPFLISKYEITQAQWERTMGYNRSRHQGPVLPVDRVSWNMAQEFCRKTGYQLPSEAQWEYACRAGTRGPYSADALLEDLGWFVMNSEGMTHPVGRKRPSPYGLYDMHGNVLEWCQDRYEADYYLRPEASGRDPRNDAPDKDETEQLDRVLRGGPFNGQPEYCRSADRWRQPPQEDLKEHGLRPALPIH
jgi:serine/threonine protein kinase